MGLAFLSLIFEMVLFVISSNPLLLGLELKRLSLINDFELLNDVNKEVVISYRIFNGNVEKYPFSLSGSKRDMQMVSRFIVNDSVVYVEKVIDYNFYVQRTEVTLLEWALLMRDVSELSTGLLYPKVNVSFVEMLLFANRLSKASSLEECYVIEGDKIYWPKGTACKGYRLPILSEWSYFSKTPSSSGLDVGMYAVVNEERMSKVASRKFNKFGLYDTIGNAEEVVWDNYSDHPEYDLKSEFIGGNGKHVMFDSGISLSASSCSNKDGLTCVYKLSLGDKRETQGFRLVRTADSP